MIGKIRRKLKKMTAIWDLMSRRSRSGNLSRFRQGLEAAYLWARNGVSPRYYMCAGLYRCNLSWRDKNQHLDAKKFLREVNKFNPKGFAGTTPSLGWRVWDHSWRVD